jgi:hypothetical protein
MDASKSDPRIGRWFLMISFEPTGVKSKPKSQKGA